MSNSAYFVKSTAPRAFVYHFNTLQVCYRHIEDLQCGSLMMKKYFFVNLQHFYLSQFSTTTHIELWLIVPTFVKSTIPRAFSVSF